MTDQASTPLPPGQKERADFPRFGLPKFTNRFPTETELVCLRISGDVDGDFELSDEFEQLTRIDQVSDFHCVTTWSSCGLRWSGYAFSEFYTLLIKPRLRNADAVTTVVFRAQDGYRVRLPLTDLLAKEVMLADHLDGKRLGIDHGAPLRLVAPAHYGYKNAKHLSVLEFLSDTGNYRSASLDFMEHPRARVQYEERGKLFPGWLLRFLYRPLIGQTVRSYADALNDHLKGGGRRSG